MSAAEHFFCVDWGLTVLIENRELNYNKLHIDISEIKASAITIHTCTHQISSISLALFVGCCCCCCWWWIVANCGGTCPSEACRCQQQSRHVGWLWQFRVEKCECFRLTPVFPGFTGKLSLIYNRILNNFYSGNWSLIIIIPRHVTPSCMVTCPVVSDKACLSLNCLLCDDFRCCACYDDITASWSQI